MMLDLNELWPSLILDPHGFINFINIEKFYEMVWNIQL